MPATLRRILILLFSLIAIIIIALLIYIPRATRQSFPQIEGKLALRGLDGPVNVYRDQMGIPHIYASTEHDLFFAQGFVHAQDRFWQMDFQRHASSGRLSEMLGDSTIDTDIFLRTMGWERIAQQEIDSLSRQSLGVLEDYAQGVNAYLEGKEGTQLSLEYLFLNLLNSNYHPAPWEPIHTLTWAKAMAWDLKDNMGVEIQRAVLLTMFSPEKIEELYPSYPSDHPIILPDFSFELAAQSQPISAQSYTSLEGLDAALSLSAQRFAALDSLFGTSPEAGLGSNSWVVSAELSSTGAPLLANDPHLSASMPSIWYQNSLHCVPVSPSCSLEVSGVSFVGAPGVIIGHNNDIAWGFTNNGADVMDLYIIKVNPDNPNQYEMNGVWVDMQLAEENIVVAGGDSVSLTARITQFGPIISDSYGPLKEFSEEAGVDLPENYAIALRWTALEPSYIFWAIIAFNRAENWEEFRLAARDFSVPSQNLLYADVEGNIGYQMPGRIPIRSIGDGRYPVPGWTDDYAWQGFIHFEDLPYQLNPPSGYIVTANNAVVTEDYPYQLADSWTYGYRAQRIVDMITAQEAGFDLAAYQQMQADTRNLGALDVLPYLMQVDLESEALDETRQLLQGWDGDQVLDSYEAALFNTFWMNLLKHTFHDDLPEDYWPGGNSRWFAVMANLLDQPENTWWDDRNTVEIIERRDDIIRRAFAESQKELVDNLGSEPAQWAWGDLHTITFEHQVMSNFPGISALFNRGPFSLPGGSAIVNANNWDASSGTFDVDSLPAKRSIMDLSNWQNSLQIHTTGQSGHADHAHYVDMAPIWATVDYAPMHWEFSTIEAESEGHLQLLPK